MSEFRVIENGSISAHKEIRENAPKYSTADLFDDESLFQDILMEKPHALINFKVFKRNYVKQMGASKAIDKRLIRIGNMNRVPAGVWAHWIVNTKQFSNIILILIFTNAM